MIEITKIDCTDNRKMEGIEELAANIDAVGLIQPIALAAGSGRYRVIAGRRRFRAIQLLNWDHLTDEQYVISNADPELVAFCENFHRANLTLAEEVEQFNQLKSGHTIHELAAMLGKTPQYVALRLNLTNLSPAWKNVLANPEKYPQWTSAKLEFIAKQPQEIQEEVANWIDSSISYYSVSEIRHRLEHEYTVLKTAIFDTTDCQNCPKRSGAADLLFPELSEKGDSCLDRSCFELKMIRHILKKIDEIRANLAADPGAEPFYLYCDDQPRYGTEARELFDRIPGVEQSWRLRKSKGNPNAFCVWGTDAGKFCRMKASYDSARPINPKNEDGTPAVDASGKKVKTLAEREAELLAKRNKLAISNLITFLEDTDTSLFKLRETRAENFQDVVLALAYQLGTCSGTKRESIPRAFQEAMNEVAGNIDGYLIHAWKCVSRTISYQLRQEINQTLDRISERTAREFCEILHWDYQADFFQPAAEEIQPGKALLAARKAAEAGK